MKHCAVAFLLGTFVSTVVASAQTPSPPNIQKAFGALTIPLNGTTSLSFTITNPNASSLSGISFTDALPSGLAVATPNGLIGSCGGGLITANPADTSISLSGAALAANDSCTFSANVMGIAAGTQVNTTGAVSSNEGGAGGTASATLTVVPAPTVSQAFGTATIPLNGTTSLSFTVTNSTAYQPLTGIGFSDTLPAGLQVATPNGLTGTCGGGTISAAAGSNNVSLSGATLDVNASCTFSFNVTGITAGDQSNTTGAISANESGTGATSNTATLTVVAPPTITKTFGVGFLALNGTTTLSFTIANPNATVALSGIGVTDALPSGLAVSTPNGLTGTCGAGTITANAGDTNVSLSGANLDVSTSPNASCTFSVNVTGTVIGVQNNTTGAVTSTEGGTGGTATASVAVVVPPSISKSFGASRIALNGTTSLSFTISNVNTVALTGVGFTDTFPGGLVVATPSGLTGSCGGGSITAVSGSNSASLSGGTIAANGSCTFQVNVRATLPGAFTNTTGAVTSGNAGTGNSATANLSVSSPPVVSQGFGLAAFPLNGTTSLSFTVNNPNATQSLTGIGFSDTLPAGLQVASPNGLTGNCGGGTITAAAGSSSLSLSGASLAGNGFCTFSVNVTGVAVGVQANTTGPISSNETGTAGISNTATVTVAVPPTITKTFGGPTVALNGTTSLSFTLTNPAANAVPLTGVGFTDTLPAGIAVAAPNGLAGSCGGGTIAATAGGNSVSLTGATLNVNASCTFSVNVTGTAAGAQNNTTGAVTSVEGGTGGTASASITVLLPPSIGKSFGAGQIPVNTTTSLSFTIAHVNSLALTGVGFSDALPGGLVVATPNGLTGSCGGGTIAAAAGSNTVSLAGATLSPSASCTFSVNVKAPLPGNLTNTTGPVTSANAGNGNAATANLVVTSAPAVSQVFGAATIPLNGTTSLSFTVANSNASEALTGIAFSDSLPAGLQVATPPGLTGTCGGTVTAVAGSNSVSLSGVSLNANASCTFSFNVTGITAGNQSNTTGAVSANESGAGPTSNTATLTVVAPPTITKTFGVAFLALNGTTTLSFTIANPNATVGLTGIGVTDALPSGLAVSTPNGLTGTCGAGTITANAGDTNVSLAGANLDVSASPNASCTFSVNVTGTVIGVQNNTTGAVTSTEGGTGGAATASVAVVVPPSISKSFGASRIALNGTTSLSFTISNVNTVALTGVGFTDTFPGGLVVATPNGLTGSCGGGSIAAVSGSNSAGLSGATLPPSTSCTFRVNVRATLPIDFTNTTGPVTSANAGTGNSATANLSVSSPPVVSQGFGFAAFPLNGTTSLTFTVNNPNATQSLTGIGFSDTLPAGLQVASPNGLTGTCGGGTITAAAGSSSLSLSGASLAGNGFCTFSVNVTGVAVGVQANTTGPISSNETGTAGISNTATVTVAVPPTITKTFGGPTVALNGTTSLSFTLTNPAANAVPLTGVGFTDTLPAGIAVATPNGLAGSCGGGTIAATAGGNSVSLTGATLNVNASCTFSVNVTGTAAGAQNNTTGAVTSVEGGTGGTASASITVLLPPSIGKSFGAATIPLNGTTTLSFTITNPAANTLALGGVGFTDTFPAGLAVATPNGLIGTCGGGTITANAGANSVSLSGASIAASASCTFSLSVKGTSAGSLTNTTAAVTSANAGNGNTATANLSVISPPGITKAFGAVTIPLNGATSLSFTVTNPNASQTLTSIGFTDTLPAGLQVAAPNGATGACGGGTIAAAAGSGSVSLAGATLAASASCTFSVNVTGTAAGVQNNTTGAVTSTEGGTGGTASASLSVVAPPSISKTFGASTIPLNGTTTLSFTVANPAPNAIALSGIGFTDNLPAGIALATPNGLTGSCGGGTITATAGGSSVSLAGATLAASGSCTFSVSVTGTAAGAQNNTTGAVTSVEGGTGGTAAASVTVLAPPSITKTFGAGRIPMNGTTSLSFTIAHINTVALSGVAFTDAFPSGIVVATPNGLSGSCGAGGTISASAGSSSVSLSRGTIPASGSCTFSVNVTGSSAGDWTNTTGAVTSTNAGTGGTATANLTVTAAPTVTKAFGAPTIPLNGTTSLTFTVRNPNSQALTGIGFSDPLPAGLQVATPSGLTSTCGGSITAVAAGNSVSLSGATLNANASCTFSVNVTGITAGDQANTTGTISANESGAGVTSNTATLTVVAPPTITKTFGSPFVALNGTTSLSFTITNPNATAALSGIGVTDTLPSGLVLSTPSGLTGTCGAGTITANDGDTSVTLTGANLTGANQAANASCTFSVNVTGTVIGVQNNTTAAITSTEGGTGATATASLAVVVPPAITKSFGAARIPVNGTTSLSFTIASANTVVLTGVGFTDTFPAGLVVATPNGLTGSCGGGSVTAAPGSNGVTLSGASIAANGSCTFSVNVTGTSAGNIVNTTTAVTSSNAGTGNAAIATLSVISPSGITTAFGAATIPLNGNTSLSFTLTNPNAGQPLSGIGFSDTLPAGLQVAAPNGVTGACGGGTITAAAGSGSVSLAGATLAAGAACTFSVNVTGTAAGVQNNTTGAVASNEGGNGGTASASLTVVAPPTITKTFGAATIALNGTTSLSFTITNPAPNATALSGIGVTDTLPAGIAVATPNALTGTCGGGTITATAGGSSVSLAGATLAANGSCTFSVNVTGTASGVQNNTTGAVTSVEGGTGGTASASTTVVVPPSISKTFGAATIPLNGTTTLSFTITNPAANALALSGVGFTDAFPSGIVVATPNGLSGSCGSGTITAAAGSNTVSLSGASVAANGSCTFSLSVKGTSAGNIANTTGAVTSTNAGTGNTATANLSVIAPPGITKTFGAATIPLNGATSLSFTVTNPNGGQTLTGIGFTDSLPAGLRVAAPNGLTGACGGGTIAAAAGSSSVSLASATLAAGASCTFSVNVTGTAAGAQNNTTGAVTSNEGGSGGTASAGLTVVAPPSITKTFGAAGIALNGTTSLSFTVTNPNATITLTGIGMTDTLPSGLVVSTPNGLTGGCGGGTIVAVAASNSISLSGAGLTASSSCTFGVNVTSTATGVQNNTTSAVTSTEGGSGGTASATLGVMLPPSIGKSFGASQISQNATTSLSFTITNPAANTAAIAGVAFTDTFPAGLVVATPNGLTGSCGGGSITAAAGSNSVALTGASIAVNGSCTFSVNVQGTSTGNLTNTTGAVTSTNAGNGNTASASLNVGAPANVAPPLITKTFGIASMPLNGTTSLTFVIVNPNAAASLSGIGFTDTLPAGLVVSSPNGLSGSCNGGTITANARGSSISLSGAGLSTNASCTFSVNVTSIATGVQNNTTGAVTSIEGGTGGTAFASIAVILPPSISESFGLAGVPLNTVFTLTFTIANPNATASLSGLSFSDTLPGGLVLATPNGLNNSCTGAIINAPAGTGSITVAGASLPAASSCTVSLSVTATTVGLLINTTGAVTSLEGGTGNTATASVTVGDVMQVGYISNLDAGDSFVNIMNTGQSGQNICVNVYAFNAAEAMVSCCACLVSPNALVSLSARNDLINNSLVPAFPSSLTIHLIPTTAGPSSSCNPASATTANISYGLRASNTTLHPNPTGTLGYRVTENNLSESALSPIELANLAQTCLFIEANGSGFGICNSCELGGLGAARQ